MSIDGYIEKVSAFYDNVTNSNCLKLELTGRAHGEDGISMYTPPGQPFLLLVDPRFVPQIGDVIWGGASSVEIIHKETDATDTCRHFCREGYIRIREVNE